MGETKSLECLSRLNDGSRMNGDVHVRFCEGLGVKFPRATLPAKSGHSPQHSPAGAVEFP